MGIANGENQNVLIRFVYDGIYYFLLFFSLLVFIWQQVNDTYTKTIHLHSSSGSTGGGGGGGSKNSHRGKIQTNSQSRDKHDSGFATRTRSLASQFSLSQSSVHGEYGHLLLDCFLSLVLLFALLCFSFEIY